MIFAGLVSTSSGPGQSSDGDASPGYSAGAMGMMLLLIALSMLFAANIFLFVYFRIADDAVWDRIPWPNTLWTATVLLLISSITMHTALAGARAGSRAPLVGGALATTALGIAFLLLQWHNWHEIQPFFEQAQRRAAERARPLATQSTAEGPGHPTPLLPKAFGFFYLLTGIHGAHVVGGVLPLLWVSAQALRGRYSPADFIGVWRVTVYWHFLDVVWLILLAVLLLGG